MTFSLNSTQASHSMLFPCATGVHVPNLGAGTSKVKAGLVNSVLSNKLHGTMKHQNMCPKSKKYLEMASAGLVFSDEVIEDKCFHMLPYNEKYFTGLFEPGKLIPPRKRASSVGRHQKRSSVTFNFPQNQQTVIKPHSLVPLETQTKHKSLQLHKQSHLVRKETLNSTEPTFPSRSNSLFLTETSYHSASASAPKQIKKREGKESHAEEINSKSELNEQNTQEFLSGMKDVKDMSTCKTNKEPDVSKNENHKPKHQKSDWDENLLSKLSPLTANWIVHECISTNKQKEKLSNVLKSWYGRPLHTDLVREEVNDVDEEVENKDQKPKKKWKKKEASVLERVYSMTPPPAEHSDPYSDDNRAPLYRQPAAFRKKKRIQNREETGAVNRTANNISVRESVQTPPPKLRDFLNPQVGEKLYETDNLYQQEWLIGKCHVYNTTVGPSEILMETGNKYQKQLQQEMPMKPYKWCNNEDHDQNRGKVSCHKPKKGLKHWTGLPQPVNDTEMLTSASNKFNSATKKTVDPVQMQKIRQNHTLVSIAREWHNKWFLCGQFADSTPGDLIKDMADIQPYVRLKAVATIAKAAEYKPDSSNNVLRSGDHNLVSELPEKIFVALECLLDDSHEQVRKAAAITLYSLERPSDKAKERLREIMTSENEVDRWAGVQCLAHYGVCDSDVVAEIIKQILFTESTMKYQQGIHLLAEISSNSNLVHCMVAEQLNSSSWRHRVIACKILSTLFGSISKDITHKLSEMMWHDWHMEVRKAAAQCLGKTSHGREVHDGIKEKMLNGTESTKLEAISRLGQLGIMTAKLLPAFLSCFDNPFVSIRCEICITCGNLQIKEERVINRLVYLATSDPAWKVKALAIQAIGKIGEVNNKIKECLLWALRYEAKAGVRAEACHSLIALNIGDDDVISILQERLLVESDHIVREEMKKALSIFGFKTAEDIDLVAEIKSEIQKLCKHNIIASQILVNEMDEAKRAQLRTMVCQTEEDIVGLNTKKAEVLEKIRSQAYKADITRSSSHLRISTPLTKIKIASDRTTPYPISREGTNYSINEDKELEALLNQDKSESWSVSSKSWPLIAEAEENVTGMGKGETALQSTVVSFVTDENKVISTDGDVHNGDDDTEAKIEEGGKFTQLQHYLSLPPSALPSSSQLSMHSLSASLADAKESKLPLNKFFDNISITDQDMIREKEKFKQAMSAVFMDLYARYADMNEDLIKIDKGFNTRRLSTGPDSADSSTALSAPENQAVWSEIPESSGTVANDRTDQDAETLVTNDADVNMQTVNHAEDVESVNHS